MSRSRILVLFVCLCGFAGWQILKPSPKAAAVEYGVNSEEIAFKRWQESQSRHWRQAVTRR